MFDPFKCSTILKILLGYIHFLVTLKEYKKTKVSVMWECKLEARYYAPWEKDCPVIQIRLTGPAFLYSIDRRIKCPNLVVLGTKVKGKSYNKDVLYQGLDKILHKYNHASVQITKMWTLRLSKNSNFYAAEHNFSVSKISWVRPSHNKKFSFGVTRFWKTANTTWSVSSEKWKWKCWIHWAENIIWKVLYVISVIFLRWAC